MDSNNINTELRDIQDQLFDLVLEKQRDEYAASNKLEPFEVYTQRMKQQYHQANEELQEHLRNGYEAIINEIDAGIK